MIAYSFRVGKTTVANIIEETCDALWTQLQPLVMPHPTTDTWVKNAEDFRTLWQFPNCIGAIDGKHVLIQAPPKSGTTFYNYKGTFSVVLLALVDARYRFTAIDVGSYGKNSDGGIFSESVLGKSLEDGSLGVPPYTSLPGMTEEMPHVIVGDEAFPLKSYLMRPFPGTQTAHDESKKIFNYRLSRAQRIVGILSSRWCIFQRKMNIHPSSVDSCSGCMRPPQLYHDKE